jgi:sortase A
MTDRLLIAQRALIGIGVALLLIWGAAHVHRHVGQQEDMAAFQAAREAVARERILLAQSDAAVAARQAASVESSSTSASSGDAAATAPDGEIPSLQVAGGVADEPAPNLDVPPPPMPDSPDYALWSPKRVEDYEASLAASFDAPQALLRIPALDLEVLVLDGIDELTLNRGVGRIPGTEYPGGLGNIGIAGHRDGFFRGLKDIKSGDKIELVTWRQKMSYNVTSIDIVEKDDLHVLAPTNDATVTLVTCYPFYYVGHAPRRYIVKATLEDAEII